VQSASDDLAAAPLRLLPRVAIPRASDAVVRTLIDALRGGSLSLGQRLPPERELATQLGVSRPVLREALERLRDVGVVESRRGNGGGIFVRNLVLPTHLLTERTELDRADLLETLEARRCVETACHVLAAERAGPDDLAALAGLVADLRQATDAPEDFVELDTRFHLRLAATARNATLAGALTTIFRDLAAARGRYPKGYGSMEAAIAFQAETLDAVRSGRRARVLAAADRHLAGLEEHFLGHRLPRLQ
jgi:GntR family transcriptional regulator, transcriptional repressor for pyruvate dehydrogenase complex